MLAIAVSRPELSVTCFFCELPPLSKPRKIKLTSCTFSYQYSDWLWETILLSAVSAPKHPPKGVALTINIALVKIYSILVMLFDVCSSFYDANCQNVIVCGSWNRIERWNLLNIAIRCNISPTVQRNAMRIPSEIIIGLLRFFTTIVFMPFSEAFLIHPAIMQLKWRPFAEDMFIRYLQTFFASQMRRNRMEIIKRAVSQNWLAHRKCDCFA